MVILAFFHQVQFDLVARCHRRAQRFGEFIEVQHFDSLQSRDFDKVGVVGDQARIVNACDLNQLGVDAVRVLGVCLVDGNFQRFDLLHSLQRL